MKNVRRSIVTLVVIGCMTCLSTAARASEHRQHDQDRNGGEPIKGTWQNIVTPQNCSTGAPAPVSFPALASLSAGGTSLSMGSSTPAASRTHVFGIWTKTSRRTYNVVGLTFTFDQAGAWTGTVRISNTLKV